LELPRPPLEANYALTFNARPHIVPRLLQRQRVQVLVNGEAIAEFSISKPSTRTCLIPWDVITRCPTLKIQFITPDSAQPSFFGGSADTRSLGVAFRSLSLHADIYSTAALPLHSSAEIAIDISSIIAVDNLPISELMLAFESLGQNCEFGLVQRHFNADPLGLLRFSSTPLPQLIGALDAKFRGMGADGTLKIELSSNGREYMINELNYGFLYHAFVKLGEAEPSEILDREMRRLPFLARKLVDDLERSEKIFVYRGMGSLEEEEVFPLVTSLRRYGPNTLLFVNLADAAHQSGTVELRSPGFLVGYVDRFAPSEDASAFDAASWVHVCRQALRMRNAATPRP